jgi:hypothetical protein
MNKALLRGQPLFLRVKFYAATTNLTGTYLGLWQVGVPEKTRLWREAMSLAPNTYHEFAVPPDLWDDAGRITIAFSNAEDVTLLMPLDEGLEVLYRDGSFGLNFARGLGIILCWLGLLAALGLASASVMSFPVAAFFSGSLLILALSSGTLSRVVEEGTVTGVNHETGASVATWVDNVLVPLFKGVVAVVNLAQRFSPIDALSTGRSITWGTLGLAFAQIVLLLGGIFAVLGMIFLHRRELATAQGNT